MAKEALRVKTPPLPQSRISFELEIPSETCKTCVNETINSISRSAKIPGFRLGKIPKQVLIQRIFFPSDRSDESKTNSDIGKSRCSRIFSNSDPTAPEDPKTATFNGLLGKKGDCLTL